MKPAGADPLCPPGMKLGSESDGPGLSWRCIPDTRRAAAVASGGSNNAAMAAGVAAGVLGLAAVAFDLASKMEATDNLGPAELDTEGLGTQSRDFNRRAFAQMNEGNFLQASLLFNIAARYSIMAGNQKERDANWKNARIARAQDSLSDAQDREKRGDIAGANRKYLEAKMYAQQASEEDLAARISEYNERMATSAAGSRPDLYQYCTSINAQLVCR